MALVLQVHVLNINGLMSSSLSIACPPATSRSAGNTGHNLLFTNDSLTLRQLGGGGVLQLQPHLPL